ncbi:MAG: alpha/beta hydrolase [Myxococcota bacterium]
MRRLLLLLLLACGATPTDRGDVRWYARDLDFEVESLEAAGETVEYLRVPGGERLLVLLAGGAQNRNLVEATLRPWGNALRDLGYAVVSPVARQPRWYEAGSEALLAATVEALAERYGGPVYVFGVSNGGIAAMRWLSTRPRLPIATVVVAPGYVPDDAAVPDVPAPITFVVGERDRWLPLVRASAEQTGGRLCTVVGAGHLLAEALSAHAIDGLLRDEPAPCACASQPCDLR